MALVTKIVQDKKIIETTGNLKSPYSILSIALFLLLIASCLAIVFYFEFKPVIGIALVLVPLALAIFVLKVVIWNILGKETIIIGSTDMRVFRDYQIIYKQHQVGFNFKDIRISYISNIDGEINEIQTKPSAKNAYYRLVFDMSDGQEFRCAFGIDKSEIELVRTLVVT